MNENLNKVVKLFADLWKQWKIVKEDGFETKELISFLPALLQLPPLLSKETKAAIIAEFKSRTPESIEALLDYAVNESGETSPEFRAVVRTIAALLILQLAFRKEPEVPALPNP